MSELSDERVRHILQEIVISLVRRACDPENRDRLKQTIRNHVPDTSAVDEFELRRITGLVASGLENVVYQRTCNLEAMVRDGVAEPPKRAHAGPAA